MIDKATVQRIKDTANIVEVVSDYVHLTRRGSNYMGLCPFHNERTPSFSVNPRRNICHCFSCGKGGSPVNFIMEKENISYHDALRQLAKKYGIKIEERELTPEERRLATEREALLIAAEAAMKIMESDLSATQEGQEVGLSYLYHRGVTEEAIKAFHLGYALDKGSHVTSLLLKQGFDLEVLKSLGITGVSQQGNNYDKFRGRVIFPIMNSSGKTVGFGGRDLKGGLAKYINSPESVLYRKNNELYGIYQAKNEIVRQDNCFLVEGYLDVISMWQSGLKNVVASSGTSLTDGQIAAIHRFTSNITLVYDGDAAGIKAALRGIDMLLSHKMKVSVLLLPDGHDPDSFSKEKSPEDFRDYVSRHSCDIIRFKMDVLMKDAGDDPRKKGEIINSVVQSIACIPEYVDRMIYVSDCARRLNIDEQAVASAVEKTRAQKVEQMKLDRRRREVTQRFPVEANPGITSADSTPDAHKPPTDSIRPHLTENSAEDSATSVNPYSAPTDNSGGLGDSYVKSELLRKNPMRPLEKRIIELIIKYGYLNMPPADSEETQEDADNNISTSKEGKNESPNILPSQNKDDSYFPIIDFIADELQEDGVEFSVPEYRSVFEIMLDAFDDFLQEHDQEYELISKEVEKERKKRQQEIAISGGSLNDIEREEIKLDNELREKVNNHLREHARLYPGKFLASHEDNAVRNIANEFIYEKYVLSKIYVDPSVNNDRYSEFDEVIRAITEWKSELLNVMLREVMSELRHISNALDGEASPSDNPGQGADNASRVRRMQELQEKLSSIMRMRSQMAKDIGERVLCPKKIR